MGEKLNNCVILSVCLFGVGVFFVIFAGIFGMFNSANDLSSEEVEVCNAIKYGQFLTTVKIGDITAPKGSQVRVDCKVVVIKDGSYANEKMFWNGHVFQAEYAIGESNTSPKIIRSQNGVSVTRNLSWETFYCGGRSDINSRVNLKVNSFTLLFDPVGLEHRGWFNCTANFTATFTTRSYNSVQDKEYWIGRKFYLDVI